jgi:hypothetical protein
VRARVCPCVHVYARVRACMRAFACASACARSCAHSALVCAPPLFRSRETKLGVLRREGARARVRGACEERAFGSSVVAFVDCASPCVRVRARVCARVRTRARVCQVPGAGALQSGDSAARARGRRPAAGRAGARDVPGAAGGGILRVLTLPFLWVIVVDGICRTTGWRRP